MISLQRKCLRPLLMLCCAWNVDVKGKRHFHIWQNKISSLFRRLTLMGLQILHLLIFQTSFSNKRTCLKVKYYSDKKGQLSLLTSNDGMFRCRIRGRKSDHHKALITHGHSAHAFNYTIHVYHVPLNDVTLQLLKSSIGRVQSHLTSLQLLFVKLVAIEPKNQSEISKEHVQAGCAC